MAPGERDDRDERGYHVSEVQRAGRGSRGGRAAGGRGAGGRGGGRGGAGGRGGGSGRSGGGSRGGGGSHSRGIPSWAFTAGLTGGAMIAVSVLALQASGAPAKTPVASPSPRASATAHPHTPPPPPPVPAHSGLGKRIVYSLSQRRVWIVPASGKNVATYPVQPGTVPAQPGLHLVTGRKATSTGADGVAVEHVIFFEYTAETWVAFSSATDDKVTAPDSSLHTGAIRSHRDAGTAMWNATRIGSEVYVVR